VSVYALAVYGKAGNPTTAIIPPSNAHNTTSRHLAVPVEHIRMMGDMPKVRAPAIQSIAVDVIYVHTWLVPENELVEQDRLARGKAGFGVCVTAAARDMPLMLIHLR
jgi:hypothetical protein